MKALASGLAAAATLLLAGCGFHLAGNRPLPDRLKLVRIDMVEDYRAAEPPLEAALRTHLQHRGAEVTEKKKDGLTVIRLTELKETRQVLSVGSDGKAQEYQLITRVTFDARTGDDVWSQPQQLEARQDYSFNAQQVLAKEQEADRLREYLQDQLAELVLLRLEAAANKPPAPPEASTKATSTTDPASAPAAAASAPTTPTAVPPTAIPPTAGPPAAVPPTAIPPTAGPPAAVPPTDAPPAAEPPPGAAPPAPTPDAAPPAT